MVSILGVFYKQKPGSELKQTSGEKLRLHSADKGDLCPLGV